MVTSLSKLLDNTSVGTRPKALLVLEDGSVYEGFSCAAEGEVFGEVCFNTSLEGYLEIISDPSYAGQIITMTYPQIGNYGVNLDDLQSDSLALRGLVVHDMCFTPSNWRSTQSLPEFLKGQGVVAIGGITQENVAKLAGSGICGVAVISAIYAAKDIQKASADLRLATEKMLHV